MFLILVSYPEQLVAAVYFPLCLEAAAFAIITHHQGEGARSNVP